MIPVNNQVLNKSFLSAENNCKKKGFVCMGKNAWKVGMASALAVGTGTVLLAETRKRKMQSVNQMTDEDSGIRLSEYRAGQSGKE